MTYQNLKPVDRDPLNYLIDHARRRIPGYVTSHGRGNINDIPATEIQKSFIDQIDRKLAKYFPDNSASNSHKIFAIDTIIADQIVPQFPSPPEQTAHTIHAASPKIGNVDVEYLLRLSQSLSEYSSYTPPYRPLQRQETINSFEYKPIATLGHRQDYDFSEPFKSPLKENWKDKKNDARDAVYGILAEVSPPGYHFKEFALALIDAAQSADLLLEWKNRESKIQDLKRAGETDRDELKNRFYYPKTEVFSKLDHLKASFRDALYAPPMLSTEDVTAIAALIKPLVESYREVSELVVESEGHGRASKVEEESRRRMSRHLKISLCRAKEARPLEPNVPTLAAKVYKSLGSIIAVDADKAQSGKFYQRIKILEEILIDRAYFVDEKDNFDEHQGLFKKAKDKEYWSRNKEKFRSLALNLHKFTRSWLGEERELPSVQDRQSGPNMAGSKRKLETLGELDRQVRPRLEDESGHPGPSVDPSDRAATPSSSSGDAAAKSVKPASPAKTLRGDALKISKAGKAPGQMGINFASWGAAAASRKEIMSALTTADSQDPSGVSSAEASRAPRIVRTPAGPSRSRANNAGARQPRGGSVR